MQSFLVWIVLLKMAQVINGRPTPGSSISSTKSHHRLRNNDFHWIEALEDQSLEEHGQNKEIPARVKRGTSWAHGPEDMDLATWSRNLAFCPQTTNGSCDMTRRDEMFEGTKKLRHGGYKVACGQLMKKNGNRNEPVACVLYKVKTQNAKKVQIISAETVG